MSAAFRVIDTGLREGRANIAFDQALIDAHKNGEIPDTIRFLRFRPTALVGRHQVLSEEVRTDYCRENGIGLARRITGGGAIYFDEGQLGWELVFQRRSLGIGNLGELAQAICEAAAKGLNRLGVPAQFRPRNDIEVDGRKLCGTGGFFDGDTLFYQGTLLIDSKPETVMAALNVAEAKLAKRNLDSAAQRITTLRQILGDKLPDLEAIRAALLDGFAEGLGIVPTWGEITAAEESLAEDLLERTFGRDDYVHEIDGPSLGKGLCSASHTSAGGTVVSYVRLAGPKQTRIQDVLITGDFFVTPPRLIYDLESHLRGSAVSEVGSAVESFFEHRKADLLTIAPSDFRRAIEDAVSQRA